MPRLSLEVIQSKHSYFNNEKHESRVKESLIEQVVDSSPESVSLSSLLFLSNREIVESSWLYLFAEQKIGKFDQSK